MTPFYITKAEMIARFKYPYYGYTKLGAAGGVWVRCDLPVRVQISVRAHELQHWEDNAFKDGRVWHWEFRAWVAGYHADKVGFFQGIWMSITDKERINLYIQRIKNNF